MARRPYDPFALIPSAKTLRAKLEEVRELERKLVILLHTAEQIEQESEDGQQENTRTASR